MADLQEAYAALQKADAAGDAEGAKQLADYIRSQSQATPAQPQAEGPKVNRDAGIGGMLGRTAAGVIQGGVIDPLLGLGQLAGHAVGAGKSVDAFVNKENEAYKNLRASLGGEGADISRISGAVGTALIPGVAASKLGTLANPASKLLAGTKLAEAAPATTGAISGATQALIAPELDKKKQENYWSSKVDPRTLLTTAGVGALGGKLAGLTQAQGAGKELEAAGLGTLGQQTGNKGIQSLERIANQYVPFTGGRVLKNQEKAVEALKGQVDEGYAKLYENARLKATPETDELVNRLKAQAASRLETGTSAGQADAQALGGIANYIEKNVGRVGQKPHYVMGPNGPELVSKPPVLEGRDLGRMIANLKNEKERAFATGSHDVGKTFKEAIEVLKRSTGTHTPDFADKLAKLDTKYKTFKDLQKAMPGRDSSLRNIIGAGEIGAMAVRGSTLSPLTLLGVSGLPLAFTNPKYARAASKVLEKGVIPAGLASTRTQQGEPIPRKKGGLSSVDE